MTPSNYSTADSGVNFSEGRYPVKSGYLSFPPLPYAFALCLLLAAGVSARPRIFASSLSEQPVTTAAAAPADSAPGVSDTSLPVPVVSGVDGYSYRHTPQKRAGSLYRWGVFRVTDTLGVPFVLRLTFENRGVLLNERSSAGASIALRNLAVRYRKPNEELVERSLSRVDYRGGGYVYELRFLPEDVQDVYDMELWGALDEREAEWPMGGKYEEKVRIEVYGFAEWERRGRERRDTTGRREGRKRK